MKSKPKATVRPLTVWILGHPQNSLLLPTGNEHEPLAVFYKKQDALDYRREKRAIYKVFKATIIRDNYEGDIGMLRRDCLELRKVRDEERRLRADAERATEAARAELAALQKQIHDGKIWNNENPRWTPRTQSALALAAKEAEASGATYVGTEHLLLGLLKQEEGIAHRHFVASGMSYAKAEYAMRVGRCS